MELSGCQDLRFGSGRVSPPATTTSPNAPSTVPSIPRSTNSTFSTAFAT